MRLLIGAVVLIGAVACTEKPPSQALRELESMSPSLTEGTVEGFILKTGEGEPLLNGIVVKASPKTGTLGSILVEQTERNPDLLPMEFALLGIKPDKWTPAVVISRHQGLHSNVTTELRLGRAVAAIGAEKVKDLGWFRPGDPVLEFDPSIDGSLLTDDILHFYRAFRGPIEFEPDDIVASYRNDPASHERLAAAAQPFISNGDGTDAISSNNWVVGGRYTQTGYPYIVNDPHRVLAIPSLRYFVHLHAPGWNVIGGG